MKLYCKIIALMLPALTLFSCAGTGGFDDTVRDLSHEIALHAYKEYWGRDWQKVIEHATEAIEADPEYPWPYSMRGAAYNAIGKPEAALKDLDTALALSSDFEPAYLNRGISHFLLKDMPRAKEDFYSALELNPDNIITLISMAEILSIEGDPQMSCRYLSKAVEMGFSDRALIAREPNFRTMRLSLCYEEIEDDIGLPDLPERGLPFGSGPFEVYDK